MPPCTPPLVLDLGGPPEGRTCDGTSEIVAGTRCVVTEVSEYADGVGVPASLRQGRLRAPIRFPSLLYLTSWFFSDVKRGFEFPVRSTPPGPLGAPEPFG